MAGLNKVMLIGRLGADPEVRYTGTGTAVANFRMATSINFTDKSGQKTEKTEWHRVVAFGKLGEICGDIAARWKTERTAIVHRVGPLSLGEISVVIAVAHPHRQPAFEAAQFAIDRIKEIVPIWKKEHWRNGAGWV